MSTHDTPRTSASIVAVDGNGLTLGNISRGLSNSDVGRLIIMTNGAARQQVRKITQVIGNNRITIDHPFNEAAFPWITEVNPVLGDLCVFSYRISDLEPSDPHITRSSNNLYTIDNLELDDGAYLHIENADLRFNSATFEIRSGGGLILGWYVRVADEPARPINTCSLRDSVPNNGGDSMRRTTAPASFGMYHQYGGGIYVPASTSFWRLYQDTPDVDVRFINVNIKGGFGARVDGTKSILIASVSNNRATVGTFNPRSAVAYSEVSAIQCLQIAYSWLREGGDGKLVAKDAVDLDRGFRIFTSGGGAGQIFRIEGKKAQFDLFGIIYVAEGGDAFQHKVQFVNDIKPSFVNQDTTLHDGTIKTHLEDVNDVVIAAGTQTIDNSQFEAVEGIYCEWTTKNNGQGTQSRRFSDPDTILTAPYTITATAWGKVPLVQLISLEDTFDAQITLLDDETLTEMDKALVDAYENLDTAQKVYDSAMSWQADNPGELHGITRFGKTLDFGDSNVTFYEDWQPNTDYVRGQLVCHDDNIYIVNNAHHSGNAFDATDLFIFNLNALTPFYFNGSVFICANTLDANIITTGRVTIFHGETSITGTIKDSSGVRLRLTLPAGSMIKGSYTPPAGAETAIPFETLATGVKIITMPENSVITLYSKANGKLPRLDRMNVGDGLNLTPEQSDMNGIVTAEAWTADISSPAWSSGNGAQITIQFDTLANIPVNSEGLKHLTSNDVAVFVNRIHFLEHYANICLESLGADHIVSNANRELEHEVAMTLQVADGVDADIFLEFPFITFDPNDHVLLNPRSAAPNQRRCFIALSLINTQKEISSRDVKRIMTEVIEPMATQVTASLTGTTANTASLVNISNDLDDVKANQEADHLTLVENIKPLPVFNTTSHIHTISVDNSIVTFKRTAGNAPDPLITYADLPAGQRFNIGGDAGATDMLIFVRNPGNAEETITIRPEFRVSGTPDADVIAPATLTLPADSLYQVMRFNIHGIHHNNEVDRISLDITGIGQGDAGGVEILQISAHRVGDPDDDIANSDGTSGTQTALLEGIRDDVILIKKTVL